MSKRTMKERVNDLLDIYEEEQTKKIKEQRHDDEKDLEDLREKAKNIVEKAIETCTKEKETYYRYYLTEKDGDGKALDAAIDRYLIKEDLDDNVSTMIDDDADEDDIFYILFTFSR